MIDIGVNLTHGQFKNDLQQMLKDSFAAGIECMILTGTDLDSSIESQQLCQKYSEQYKNRLFSTAGVHPHDAASWTSDTASQIRELLNCPEVVAVGETGLDFNRDYSPRQEQIASFEAQIELAADSGLPMFLHERDAFETQFDILQNYRDQFGRAVVHCFTGTREALYKYLDLDLYIGITGWVCDERRGLELAELVSDIPLNRLMVETDAPFLLPRNIEPKPASRRNEPRYLDWVIMKIAQCYELSDKEITDTTSANARAFFDLPSAEPPV
jgi:TatD DNase family protein